MTINNTSHQRVEIGTENVYKVKKWKLVQT